MGHPEPPAFEAWARAHADPIENCWLMHRTRARGRGLSAQDHEEIALDALLAVNELHRKRHREGALPPTDDESRAWAWTVIRNGSASGIRKSHVRMGTLTLDEQMDPAGDDGRVTEARLHAHQVLRLVGVYKRNLTRKLGAAWDRMVARHDDPSGPGEPLTPGERRDESRARAQMRRFVAGLEKGSPDLGLGGDQTSDDPRGGDE